MLQDEDGDSLELEFQLTGSASATAEQCLPPRVAEARRTDGLRVSEMDVRYIELDGEIERTLLEVYAALALNTLVFNSFETH